MDAARRKQLREWLKERIENRDSVNLPELADEATEFFSDKPQFVREAMAEMMHGYVYEMGQKILKDTRGEHVFMLGDEAVTDTEFKKRSKVLGKRFMDWMEHTGDDYERLMTLQAPQLTDAARARERQANTQLRVASFLRRVASGLSDGQRVEDRYSAEELEELWSGLEQEVAA